MEGNKGRAKQEVTSLLASAAVLQKATGASICFVGVGLS